jgi:4-hydroxybenzoate polyprenyltransferase
MPGQVYGSIFVFSLSVAAVYILNQIADIEVDKKNGGLPLLASGIVGKTSAWICAGVLFLFSVIIPLISGDHPLILLSTSSLLLGILYSFKPTYFSGKPILDFISNALGYGVIAFGAGWYLSGNTFFPNSKFFSSSLPYFLLMCAGSISSTVPDKDADTSENKNTTAVVFGASSANTVAILALAGSLVTSLYQNDFIAAVCSIVPLPFYIGFMIKPNQFFMESTYKTGGALTMICAALILPLILPVGIIVFISTLLYFRIRHKVLYPSLVPVR